MLVKIKAEGMSGHYVTNKGMLYTLYQQVVFQDTLYQQAFMRKSRIKSVVWIICRVLNAGTYFRPEFWNRDRNPF